MEETLDILKALIKSDSQCTKSNKDIILYIKKLLNKFEIKEFSFRSRGIELFNIVVKINGKSSANPLVFLGHTDTVPASSKWDTNPLEPIAKEEKLYGLGASDMKAGLACILAAALSLEKTPEKDIYLIFDADEEGDGVGGRELLKSFSLKDARVIVAEPSDRKIIYSHKGCLDILIELEGKEGHSSQADFKYCRENSAVHKALEISNKILEYAREIELKKDEFLGKPTLNIGRIEGGTGANIVAGRCKVKLCRRLIPSENIEEEYEKIKNIVYSMDKKAKITPTFWAPTFNGNKDGELANQILKLSKGIFPELFFGVKPSTTEAGLFQKYGDTLIFGPGSLDTAHKPNEWVDMKDLEKFTKIYKLIMEL